MSGSSHPLPPDAVSADRSSPVIEVIGLEFRYPTGNGTVLALGQLALAPGERLFVHGPSGCGKSTLMSLLAGVLLADRGRVALLGVDWNGPGTAARDRRRGDHVGYLFQQFNLLNWLPVIDNVCLPCRFSGRRARRATLRSGGVERDACRWLDALGIGEALRRQPAGALSVGEQQRVAAARALIGEPELLLADEPTSALDSDRRDEFIALLLAACDQVAAALVFVSHDRSLQSRFDRSLALGGSGA